ncbi:MAG: hypothetical protein JWO67_4519 [Streptosporangiaceae bacterium]|nr:hypothetical protein [Streptosporangiaceae bacterium]
MTAAEVAAALFFVAVQLEKQPGYVAQRLCRDCWSTFADLENHCHCEEVGVALVAAAWHHLALVA